MSSRPTLLRPVDYNAEREAFVFWEAGELERMRSAAELERKTMEKRQVTWEQVRSVMSRTEYMTAREIATKLRLAKTKTSTMKVRDVLAGLGHLKVSRRMREDMAGTTGGRRPHEYRLIEGAKPRADRCPGPSVDPHAEAEPVDVVSRAAEAFAKAMHAPAVPDQGPPTPAPPSPPPSPPERREQIAAAAERVRGAQCVRKYPVAAETHEQPETSRQLAHQLIDVEAAMSLHEQILAWLRRDRSGIIEKLKAFA